MKTRFAVGLAGILLVILAVGVPCFAQQEKGNSELSFNGSIMIPHSNPGDNANGLVQIGYGYYFTSKDRFGFDTIVFLNGSAQDVFLDGRYRHLFPTKNPKVFPFIGGAAGFNVFHESSGTNKNFLGSGEFGLKFWLSQRTSFEASYNFEYIRVAGQSFKENSSSVLLFGFTYLFGGKEKK
jgi:hypothetical protein